MRGAELVSARRSDSEGEELLRNALRNWFTTAHIRGLSYSSEDGLRKVAVGEIRSYLTINAQPESWLRMWEASIKLPGMDSTSLATTVDKMSKALEVKKNNRSQINTLRAQMGSGDLGRNPWAARIQDLEKQTDKKFSGVLTFILTRAVR